MDNLQIFLIILLVFICLLNIQYIEPQLLLKIKNNM